jgi:hypothetical protein
MQDVKDTMFGQILDDFLASGDREAALERMQLLSTMHNQKVIGVVLEATESHCLPGGVIISTLENEAAIAKDLKGAPRELWKQVGLAYSGPDQTLPKDMIYMDGGLYVNCSDDLSLGVYPGPDGKTPSVTIGSEENPDLLTLAFPSKENLEQIIDVLQGIAETMEPIPCSSSTGS